MRASDEDQRLRDDGDLEVDDHVQHRVVRGGHIVVESHAKLVLEEGGFHDDDDERDAISSWFSITEIKKEKKKHT